MMKEIEMIRECRMSDELYPPKLKKLSGAPEMLYYKGDIELLTDNVVAVIGKRERSEKYKQIAYQIGAYLADKGYVVLNGLACGCDTDAIRGALSKNGKVVAVMPCGLDQVYPNANKKLADQILEKGGCILSEYPPGLCPEKYRFVQRDRIQAALSDRIVVVESEKNGGTMHTVNYAVKYHRPIACVMEEEKSASPAGNTYLVKENIAASITGIESLEAFLQQRRIEYEQINLFDICEET